MALLHFAGNGVCSGDPQTNFTIRHRRPIPPAAVVASAVVVNNNRSRRSRSSSSSHVVGARKISRTGRFDSRNRRGGGGGGTTTKEEEEVAEEVVEKKISSEALKQEKEKNLEVNDEIIDDGLVLPELPGEKPDFWEGPQWNALGFFVEYLWAFGVVFALIACGIAVATYNEGATDFKETPAYKESMQSRQLLEEPEASNSDVFDANPTEEAPSLE